MALPKRKTPESQEYKTSDYIFNKIEELEHRIVKLEDKVKGLELRNIYLK